MRSKKLLCLPLLISLLISATACGYTISPGQNPSDLIQDQSQPHHNGLDCGAHDPWMSNLGTVTDEEQPQETLENIDMASTEDETKNPGTASPSVSSPPVQKPAVNLVSQVTLNTSNLKLKVNETNQLTAKISPEDATGKEMKWTSSNPKIVTVDSSGLITTRANGTALVTVTTACGGKTATAKITVTTPVTGISLNFPFLTMIVNKSTQLAATITPSNASDKEVIWNSSNSGVATVSSSGLVSAKGKGTAVISAKTRDGGRTVQLEVLVIECAREGTADELLLLSLVNQEREKAGLPPLKLHLPLTTVARFKCQDMIDNNYFSHTSPTYGTPFDMMKQFGISYTAAGENLAILYASVEAAHQGLMDSDTHRKIIMSDKYTHIGIGIVRCSEGRYYVTQMFIR